MKKSPNDTGNKKSTVFKNIVTKYSKIINKTKKSTSSNQKDLFNPELFLTIDKINKKFGKDTVCFGDQLGNLDYDKLLDSNDFNLPNKVLVYKKYQLGYVLNTNIKLNRHVLIKIKCTGYRSPFDILLNLLKINKNKSIIIIK